MFISRRLQSSLLYGLTSCRCLQSKSDTLLFTLKSIPMKVAVIGSRTLNSESHYQQLSQELDALVIAEAQAISLIISGLAVGIDKMGERFALERGIPTQIFLPDYQSHGRFAPLVRNQLIVNEADICLVLWDGKSKGTAHALRLARRKRGLRLIVVVPLP